MLYGLGDVFFNTTNNSTRPRANALTLTRNLGLMVREEGMPNLANMLKFSQQVLELSKMQLLLILGDLV